MGAACGGGPPGFPYAWPSQALAAGALNFAAPFADLADFKTCHTEHSGFRILKRAILRSAPDWRSGPIREVQFSSD